MKKLIRESLNEEEQKRYTVEYQYGTYSEIKTVIASDEEEAIRKVWRLLKPYMSLSMAYKSTKVIKVEDIDDES